jgi:carboxyl-terminal processing protease
MRAPVSRPSLLVRSAVLALALLAAAPSAHAQSSYEYLQTFSGLVNQVRQNYVDSVTTGQLVQGAIRGMLASLDPHSYFLSSADNGRMVAWRSGQLAGAGVMLEESDADLVVQGVFHDTPAAHAGVLPGDRLISLNDTVVAGLSAEQAMLRLIGERGTHATLLFERGPRLEGERFIVRLRYDVIRPRAVTVARTLPSGIGYIRLEEFLESAGPEIRDAASHVLRGNPKRLILDLRSNPGGIVPAAVDVAAEFLPEDQVVFRTEGRRRGTVQTYATRRNGGLRDVQMLVLIDEHTASAAEALAGSLQDHDRALIAGRRSFGKALMQMMLVVPPNDDVVWLTVGHVLTPGGRLIQRRYRGLSGAQYRALAGQGGAAEDTTREYRTDHGRLMHGGGGITPDTLLPATAALPAWFFAAADSGLDHALTDSVAATLGADVVARERWIAGSDQWRDQLVTPFLARVRERLHVRAEADSALVARLGRILGYRATEVRWGEDAALDFLLRNDPDIQAAVGLFPAIPRLLNQGNR